MTFLNPTYLWLVLGGLVPLAIHLWSRRKVITIKVGSIRLLRESEPKRTSSIRLNELWLLVLRTLTIFLIAVLLAGPRLRKESRRLPILYLIEASLLENAKVKRLVEETPVEQIRVLAEGFPDVGHYRAEETKKQVPAYWQLARDMNNLPADSVVVLSEGFVSGLKGKRPLGGNHVHWTVLPTETAQEELLALERGAEYTKALTVYSDGNRLTFQTANFSEEGSDVKDAEKGDSVRIAGTSVPVWVPTPLRAIIVYHDSLSNEKRYLGAALKAVANLVRRPLQLDESETPRPADVDSYDISIWLGKLPQSDSDAKRLIFKPDPMAHQLIVAGEHRGEYFLTRSLNSENIFTDHLAEELYTLLGLRHGLKEAIETADRRTLTVDELRPQTANAQREGRLRGLTELSPWVWGLLLLTMGIERVLAKYRKQ